MKNLGQCLMVSFSVACVHDTTTVVKSPSAEKATGTSPSADGKANRSTAQVTVTNHEFGLGGAPFEASSRAAAGVISADVDAVALEDCSKAIREAMVKREFPPYLECGHGYMSFGSGGYSYFPYGTGPMYPDGAMMGRPPIGSPLVTIPRRGAGQVIAFGLERNFSPPYRIPEESVGQYLPPPASSEVTIPPRPASSDETEKAAEEERREKIREAGRELRRRWCHNSAHPERMTLEVCMNSSTADGGTVDATDGGGILTLPAPVSPADTAPPAP